MSRCSSSSIVPSFAALALTTIVAIAPVSAQVQRNFPENSLRGTISFGNAPQIVLNNKSAQLAPGARIRNGNNMIVLSASLTGQSATVNYTLDPLGLVMDVWLLRSDEIQKFWPQSQNEAANLQLDYAAQTWKRR